MYNNKLTLIDAFGLEKNYNIVAKFSNGKSEFIAFTDYEGNTEECDLMILKYDLSSNNKILEPVEESEKGFVEDYLKKYVFTDEMENR